MRRRTAIGPSQRLGVVVVVAATALVLALSAIKDLVLSRYLSPTGATSVQILLAIAGVAAFTWGVFNLLTGVQAQLKRQNEELTSLHLAGLAVNHDLKIDTVLQRVVDEARRITKTRYSALMAEGHSKGSPLFLVSGISVEERERIGSPPRGRGVLGLAFRQKRSIRLEDIAAHEESVGFPPHHPPMRTLLTVPISIGGDVFGQLYLSDKLDGESFDSADQEIAQRFATLAALAIKNAEQLAKIEGLAIATERNRVAREMHDNTAQVLSYVNMKTQAATVLVASGNSERAMVYLEEVRRAAQEAIDDLRDQIAGLRAADADMQLDKMIAQTLQRWSRRSGIPSSVHFPEGLTTLPSESRLQVLRIVQEALTNIEKHAGASRASVTAFELDQDLIFDVDDDGQGFKAAANDSGSEPQFGVAIMRERARALRGNIEFGRSDCGGARVRIRVPIARRSRLSSLT